MRIYEKKFSCCHCGEMISFLLDLSVDDQTAIEDCEVCCRPIKFGYVVEDEQLVDFYYEPSD
tara:strand:- start:158 stop:343 length:186 start_codon:yes stop_codon:yes gene_type:complete